MLAADRDAARERFDLEPGRPCLLVFGGSQGARSINRAALEAFAGAAGEGRDFAVIHVSGARDHPEAAATLASAPHPRAYTLLDYEPNLAATLAAADLVLARSGGSIFEIAAAGDPAILVPYPYAAGRHQHANAAWMADAGAAVVIEDDELDPARLAAVARELLGDEARLEAMAAASLGLARPDAAQRIAAEVLAAIGNP